MKNINCVYFPWKFQNLRPIWSLFHKNLLIFCNDLEATREDAQKKEKVLKLDEK
jgi:hypothetical protein